METTGKTYEYDEALRARTEAYTDMIPARSRGIFWASASA